MHTAIMASKGYVILTWFSWQKTLNHNRQYKVGVGEKLLSGHLPLHKFHKKIAVVEGFHYLSTCGWDTTCSKSDDSERLEKVTPLPHSILSGTVWGRLD